MEAATAAPGRPTRSPVARATASPLGGPAAYLAELLGTFLLVFFVVVVLSLTAAPPAGFGFADFAVIGLVHVFVLALIITAFGSASGAHFNPAVTIALLVRRKIAAPDAAIYIIVQLAGAIAATLLAKVLLEDASEAVGYGATTISEGRFLDGAVGKAMVVEFIGTFILMTAIMATAVNPRGDRDWAPWIIGIALGLGVMTLGPLTGAGFNPARSFGPALVGDFGGVGDFLLVYVLAPILGAIAAAFAYHAIVLGPQDRVEERPIDTLD